MERNEKEKILEGIASSKTFSRAPSSCVLLKFLVDATLEGRDIKETTIGMELYGKTYQEDNAHIRVNIYHLRKKLDKYYEEEGKDDKWKIKIKKGQYQVEFEKCTDEEKIATNKNRKIGIAATILLFPIIVWSIQNDEHIRLWQPFFNNGKETTLFIGDFFGIMGNTATGRNGWNRDYTINDLDDFYKFIEKNPSKKDELAPANYTYVTGMAAYATLNFSRLFHPQNRDFSIRYTSQASINDITENNSIYIGPLKNKNLFIEFFNDANTKFDIAGNMLSYRSQDLDTLINMSIGDGSIYEYAIVSRFKGPNNTEQFLFFSDHDIGVKATTDKFYDKTWIEKEFVKLIGDAEYFTAIFLVKGKERTDIGMELLFLDILE